MQVQQMTPRGCQPPWDLSSERKIRASNHCAEISSPRTKHITLDPVRYIHLRGRDPPKHPPAQPSEFSDSRSSRDSSFHLHSICGTFDTWSRDDTILHRSSSHCSATSKGRQSPNDRSAFDLGTERYARGVISEISLTRRYLKRKHLKRRFLTRISRT